VKANVIEEQLSDGSTVWNVKVNENTGIDIVTFHCYSEDDAHWLRDALHECTIDVSW